MGKEMENLIGFGTKGGQWWKLDEKNWGKFFFPLKILPERSARYIMEGVYVNLRTSVSFQVESESETIGIVGVMFS